MVVIGAVLALFAIFEIYGPALKGPFVFDDRYLPFLDPKVGNASLRQWLAGVRPMLMLTYWLNYQASATEPFGYKVVNVIFHFEAGLMIWLVLAKMLDWAGVERRLRMILSIAGAAFFLVHPVQTESVAYVASRSEAQSVFLFLAAFALFLYRKAIAVGWGTTAAILVLLAAAFLTKEHAAVLPAVLLLTDYYWNPGFSTEGIRRNWRLYVTTLIFGIAGLAFVIFRILPGAKTAGFAMRDFRWYDYFFTQCRAIWLYVRLFFFPYGQNVDYDFPLSRGLRSQGAIIGLIALIAVSAAAWIYRRRTPLASYGWFTFLILLAPTSSFLPIQDLVVERRLYLPFIGMLLVCMEGLRRLRLRRSALVGGLACVVVLFGYLAYQRNLDWSSEIALWKDSAEKSPSKSRPRFHLAYAYYESGQCADAAREYAKAADLEKEIDTSLLVDWGLALDCAGRQDEAIQKLRAAANIKPTGHVYSLIGMVYAKQRKRAEAMAALDTAEKLDRNFEMIYVYRGNLYLLSQEYDRASEQFRKALALSPDNQAAISGLIMAQRRQPVS